MLIFEKTVCLSPADDKTNIPFDFQVPKGISKLIVDYSYSPKTLEDNAQALEIISEKLAEYGAPGRAEEYLPIKNLITLSFDKNGEYIGAAHRQPNRQHIEISDSSAAPGLYKCAVGNARWRVVLNVHCCLTDVRADIKIQGV